MNNDTLRPVGNILLISKPRLSSKVFVASNRGGAMPGEQMPPDRAVVVAVGPGERRHTMDGQQYRLEVVGGDNQPLVPGDVIYCEWGMSAPVTGSDHLFLMPSTALLATAPGMIANPVLDADGKATGEYHIIDAEE